DWYKLNLDDNAPLQAKVTLPSQQGGEFVNTLVPALNLFDSSGNLVASGDATLSYHVPHGAAGTYYLEVLPSPNTPQPTSGEYTLEIKHNKLGDAETITPAMAASSLAPATNSTSTSGTDQLAPATSSSTSMSGTAQAAPLAASVSASAPAFSSLLVANSV